MSAECVRVVVRVRPLNSTETAAGHKRAVDVDTKNATVSVLGATLGDVTESKTFPFDAVFDQGCKQRDVYDGTARKIVDSVLEGYNGTIFAYGQTGAGKSFTMQGGDDPDLWGIIPNAFRHIFDAISLGSGIEWLVRVAYVEIYNEQLRDLLSGKANLPLREGQSGVYVQNLDWFVVKTVPELDKLLNEGNSHRKVASTKMNAESSRSHSIFTVIIERSEIGADGEPSMRQGKLNLVDLAGSERQSKTGATGQQLKEGAGINLSLSALGNVIGALTDPKAHHIPYRDSKLTRLLQDSLGGSAKTVMVANVGPATYNVDETMSTLRYATRAKKIQNKPKINEDPKDALLRQFQDEIQKLKDQLAAVGGGAAPGMAAVPTMAADGSVVMVAPPGFDMSAIEAERARMAEELALRDEQIAERQKEAEELKMLRAQLAETGAHRAPAADDGSAAAAKQREVEEERARITAELAARDEALAQKQREAEEERARIAEQLAARDEEMAERQREAEELKERLASMEQQLVVGGESIMDRAARQELELKRHQAALEEQAQLQRRLQEELQAKESLAVEEVKKYSSLQEEVAGLREQLEKMGTKLKSVREEAADAEKEAADAREDTTSAVKELQKQLALRDLIINSFIPPEYRAKIEGLANYDEETEEWKIPRLDVAGTSVPRPQPASRDALLPGAQPKEQQPGAANPAALDMPDRTTTDYDDDGGNRVVLKVAGGREAIFLQYSPSKGEKTGKRPKTRVSSGLQFQHEQTNRGEAQLQFPQARGLLNKGRTEQDAPVSYVSAPTGKPPRGVIDQFPQSRGLNHASQLQQQDTVMSVIHPSNVATQPRNEAAFPKSRGLNSNRAQSPPLVGVVPSAGVAPRTSANAEFPQSRGLLQKPTRGERSVSPGAREAVVPVPPMQPRTSDGDQVFPRSRGLHSRASRESDQSPPTVQSVTAGAPPVLRDDAAYPKSRGLHSRSSRDDPSPPPITAAPAQLRPPVDESAFPRSRGLVGKRDVSPQPVVVAAPVVQPSARAPSRGSEEAFPKSRGLSGKRDVSPPMAVQPAAAPAVRSDAAAFPKSRGLSGKRDASPPTMVAPPAAAPAPTARSDAAAFPKSRGLSGKRDVSPPTMVAPPAEAPTARSDAFPKSRGLGKRDTSPPMVSMAQPVAPSAKSDAAAFPKSRGLVGKRDTSPVEQRAPRR